MDTKKQAYLETRELRRAEKLVARLWFRDNPTATVSRADLVDILKKPTCHVTRIVYDLMKEGSVVHAFNAPSKHSSRKVEYVQYSGVMYEPQAAEQKVETEPQPRSVEVRQLELFPND